MRLLCIFLLLIFCAFRSEAQFIDNGSLEGPVGTNTPDNWFSCLASSTVDVGPGVWGITKEAHDGATFINMVCRGPEQPNRGSCEELSQTLNNTLEAGKCYRFEVYLSFDPTFGISAFRNSLDLIINAGTDACSRDLEIGRYNGIDHEDWRRYVTYINPSQDLDGMLLEVQWSTPQIYSGHMLVDAMSIEEISQPPLRELTLCEGESVQLTAFNSEDALAILWDNGSEQASINVDEPGTYSVDVTLGNCVFTETFEVKLQEAPDLILNADVNICPDDEIILDATLDNASYLWDDGSSQARRTVTEPGTYSVLVTVGDCINEYRITMESLSCPAILEMPNAFTPNEDFKNDLLTPIRTENMVTMQTVIYNRWGEQVYTTSNLMIEWNGNLPNGDPAPPATYYYRIVYSDPSGSEFSQKGTVTLIR